ncbi:hypothetical protein BJ912DRAFT_1132827 [Pholiota molesta]|nr:hypothetical protein BJ912DRAFT_1132827 [Pholiota molesta]
MSAPVVSPQLNEGCRILTISASLAGSISFIERVKALSESKTESIHADVTTPQLQTSETGPVIAHYIISNRYYTAPVHFAAYELSNVYPGLFSLDRGPDYKPPPALIYVWVDGEPYVKHIEELSRIMAQGGYEPEVCLAVRIPKPTAPAAVLSGNQPNVDETTVVDDGNTDIDSTLMSFGFEYVDATRELISPKDRDPDTADDDIPSLPRVLDALSTIMWPSMQSSKTTATKTRSTSASAASQTQRDLERISIMEELLSVSGISGISRADARPSETEGHQHRTDDEDDADSLFSPYEFNSNSHFVGTPPAKPSSSQKPWLTGSSSSVVKTPSIPIPRSSRDSHADGRLASSPKEIGPASPFGLGISGVGRSDADVQSVSIGFEDDFTVFVSAPAEPGSDKSKGGARAWSPLDLSQAGFEAVGDGEETPMATAFADSVVTGDSLGDQKGLTPASANTGHGRGGEAGKGKGRRNLYRSLGSVSDFGADDSDRNEYSALGEEPPSDEYESAEEWEDNAEERDEVAESWEENTEEWEDANDLDEEADEDMPTRQEILATAARIFGGVPGTSLPGAGLKSAPSSQSSGPVDTAHTQTQGANRGGEAEHVDPEEIGPAGPIDIESVLRSLQGLREEIAGVDNEEERRRMAARVALGFVYGMDLEKMDLGSGSGGSQ